MTSSTIATGRSRDRDVKSLIFLGVLWFSLFFGVAVLFALIVDTAIKGAPRFDWALITHYTQSFDPEQAARMGEAGYDEVNVFLDRRRHAIPIERALKSLR